MSAKASVSSKRKSSSSAPAADKVHVATAEASGSAQPKRKTHLSHADASPAVAAAASSTVAAGSFVSREHHQFMSQQYGPAVPVRKPAAAGAVGVPSYVHAPPTAEQLAFVNQGLARWHTVRTAWVSGKDISGAADATIAHSRSGKFTAAAASSSAAAAAAAASSSAAATPLPHALSSHAQARPGKPAKRSSDDDDADEGDFVAADSVSGSDGEDVNLDVPRIIACREAYSRMDPPVKLGHMVDILNCCWEEEDSD